MSITTYTELQIAVANELGRDELLARITEMIARYEGRVKRRLRVRQMEKRATASTVGGQATLPLPTDFLSMRNLKIRGNPIKQLIVMSPHHRDQQFASTTTDKPEAYSVVGSELIFSPTPDGVYTVEMDYYHFIPLSTGAPTNWLLTAFPDAYLFGTCAEAKADERAAEWMRDREQAFAEIESDDRRARWNGAPLVMRPDFNTP